MVIVTGAVACGAAETEEASTNGTESGLGTSKKVPNAKSMEAQCHKQK